MAHDPRAAEAMKKYQRALNEINGLGAAGFAHLLDTADKDEMDDLLTAVEVVSDSIERTKRSLAGGPARG